MNFSHLTFGCEKKKNLGLCHITLFPIPIGTKEFNLENEKTHTEIDQDNAGISFFKLIV